jgi:uncharacterized membrane protein
VGPLAPARGLTLPPIEVFSTPSRFANIGEHKAGEHHEMHARSFRRGVPMSTSPIEAAIAEVKARPERMSTAPDMVDRILAIASSAFLILVMIALFKGQAEWNRVPLTVWAHILTIIVALVLTPIMLLRRRGDRNHRVLGWIWAASLFGTAFLSLFVKVLNPGHFSYIHLLSIFTIVQVPLIVLYARRHDHKRHRQAVRGMVIGALLVAGFFTLPFGRLIGHWLFS